MTSPRTPKTTVAVHLKRCGIPRRDFLQFCTQLMVAAPWGLAITEKATAQEVTREIGQARRPSVIWLHFQDCTGCSETLLRTSKPDLADLILHVISLDYRETLMAACGNQAAATLRQAVKDNAGKFVLVVEGSIPMKDQGVYMKLAGKPALNVLKDVASQAGAIVAIGSCASWGGIPSADPNPTGAVGVGDIIKSKPIVNLPGCPPNPHTLLGVVFQFARKGTLAQSLSSWTRNSPQEFKSAQAKVKALVASGQLGIFANGYWGHPAMHLSPEVSLLAFTHYLQALEFQRKSNQVVAILGGKTPHIQNLTVGGVANAIDLDSLGTLTMDRLAMIRSLIDEVIPFVHEAYFPDVCAIAGMYPEWLGIGAGARNYMAVPDLPTDSSSSQFDLPGGVIFSGDLASVSQFRTAADTDFRRAVTEDATHAWYKGGALHPWKGQPQPEYTDFQDNGKYTWVKAPRYDGRPMEVGPLANVLVGYAQGHPLTRKWTDVAFGRISAVAGRKVAVDQLQSTMGRYAARAIRSAMLADPAVKHCELLTNNVLGGDVATHNPPQFPREEIEGVGTHEAPRGTLSHWVVVKDGKLTNYQAVVPTTWNASPRDSHGNVGPYEASLLRNPVADPERPLELLRTVHSFDPCMACACHTFDPNGREIAGVKVI